MSNIKQVMAPGALDRLRPADRHPFFRALSPPDETYLAPAARGIMGLSIGLVELK